MHDDVIKLVREENMFIVTTDIPITITDKGGKVIIHAVIPAGFKTNLITGLPSVINNMLKEKVAICFVKHDYLYTYKLVSRKIADNNLYQDLREYLPFLMSYVIRLMCRVFGKFFW